MHICMPNEHFELFRKPFGTVLFSILLFPFFSFSSTSSEENKWLNYRHGLRRRPDYNKIQSSIVSIET